MDIDDAQDKWERKTSNAGSRWHSAVRDVDNSDWQQGVANFLGTSQANIEPDWETEVRKVSASDFQSSIDGKGDKWASNLERGLTDE